MLDKDSSIPIYTQLEEVLISKIKNREYIPGESLPTERELTELFGVSRMTIRHAISNLVNKGILYRIPSKGAYVSKEVIQKNLEIESFTDDMTRRGLTPGSKVIQFEKIIPSEDIREKLNLNQGEMIYFLHRIRLANDEPMAIEYCYLPEKYFHNITKYNMGNCSLYAIMKEEYGADFHYMKQSIRATNIGNADANMLLGKSKGFALVSDRLVCNVERIPIEYTKTLYNSERYSFDLVIASDPI